MNGNIIDAMGNSELVNSGTSTAVAGKIGQAMRKTSGSYLTDLTNIPDNLSISLWYKHNGATWASECIFGTRLGSNGFMLYRNASDTAGYYRAYFWYNSTSSTIVGYNQWPGISGLSPDTWYHLVMTRDSLGNFRLYKDGTLIYNGSPPSDFVSWNNNGATLAFHAQGNGSGYTAGDISFNDIRIYDHALSPKEVKELAKAKILHYKFDDFQEPTENLLLNTSEAITSSSYGIKDYPLKTPLIEGRTYTVSMKATLGEGKTYFGLYNSGGSVSVTSLNTNHLGDDGIYRRTFTWRVGTSSNTYLRVYHMPSSTVVESTIEWIQIEEKPYSTEYTPDVRAGTVHDCSGYDNHAELALATTPRWTNDAKIGDGAYDFAGVGKEIRFIKPTPKLQEFTLSAWVYNVQGDSRQSIIRNFWEVVGTSIAFWSYDFTDEYWRQSPSGVVPYGQWTHIATTWDGSVIRHYANGELVHTSATSSGTSQEFLGIAGYSGRNFSGKIDDVRIYATALSDDDIKELYQTRGSIDSHGNLYVQYIKEPENIGLSANNAIKNKTFAGGLGRYTQAHCQVTLTDRGLRIYRTPNLTQSTDGNVMYGGMRISLLDLLPGGIQEGRRYKVTFDVEGHTYQSNSPIYITNNMGWGGGGLDPNPLVIKNDSTLGANFQGHKKCEYIFEVRDSIYKVCTTSYSSFVAGNIYPSYNHLTFHFGYGTTGAIGTDIYITNFKIVDITDTQLNSISDKGIATYDDFSELGPMGGIIGYWPLDGHTQDYSGNNNHGTNNGATVTSGIRGSAYSFDGSSSYIRANNILSQGSPFSISFWTKVFGTSNQCLGCTRTATGNGMSIFIISNKIRFDTDHQWTTGYTVPRNEWIHITLTQDHSGKRLYVNAILEDSTSSTGSMSNLSDIFQIGASHSNGSSLGNYLDGIVCDYRIYNRSLSPEEIKSLYDATKPNAIPMQLSNDGTVYLAGELKEA